MSSTQNLPQDRRNGCSPRGRPTVILRVLRRPLDSPRTVSRARPAALRLRRHRLPRRRPLWRRRLPRRLPSLFQPRPRLPVRPRLARLLPATMLEMPAVLTAIAAATSAGGNRAAKLASSVQTQCRLADACSLRQPRQLRHGHAQLCFFLYAQATATSKHLCRHQANYVIKCPQRTINVVIR